MNSARLPGPRQPLYWVRGEDYDASYDLAVALALAEEQAGSCAEDLAEYHRACEELAARRAEPAPPPGPADRLERLIRKIVDDQLKRHGIAAAGAGLTAAEHASPDS